MKTGPTVFTFFVYTIGFQSRSSLILGSNILPNLYWNTTNPIFMISNTDHIIDVNKATSGIGHQHDQIDIVCPQYKNGTPEEIMERHVIYNVNKDEYDSCMITNKNPRIVGKCGDPLKPLFYTIRFRSFSPMPNALEFHPGKSYYFISTSSPIDVDSRIGGYCRNNNMKVVFKVAEVSSGKLKPQSTSNSRQSDIVKAIDENVINSKAKAVKWKEEKSMEKKKYYYNGEGRRENNNNLGSHRGSQFVRDRKMIRDEMLSDEESKFFFYTTTKVVEPNFVENQNLRTFERNSEEQSLLKRFSSSSGGSVVPVSYYLLLIVSILMPFTKIYV